MFAGIDDDERFDDEDDDANLDEDLASPLKFSLVDDESFERNPSDNVGKTRDEEPTSSASPESRKEVIERSSVPHVPFPSSASPSLVEPGPNARDVVGSAFAGDGHDAISPDSSTPSLLKNSEKVSPLASNVIVNASPSRVETSSAGISGLAGRLATNVLSSLEIDSKIRIPLIQSEVSERGDERIGVTSWPTPLASDARLKLIGLAELELVRSHESILQTRSQLEIRRQKVIQDREKERKESKKEDARFAGNLKAARESVGDAIRRIDAALDADDAENRKLETLKSNFWSMVKNVRPVWEEEVKEYEETRRRKRNENDG